MAINKTTQYTTNPESIPITTELGEELLSDALDGRLVASNNLSDVIDQENARVNIGIGPNELEWRARAVGEPFALRDDLPGVNTPPNSGDVIFIKLTAGEDGVGGFNEGLLTAESVSGTAPLVVATAEIATGPLAGETVNLLNSENRYVMPGENSGAVANDQMQQITGSIDNARWSDISFENPSGALDHELAIGTQNNGPAAGNQDSGRLLIDSANSPNARTGDHTNVKHQQATYYMRIQ